MADPVYVIGDVHGQLAALKSALDWVAHDGGEQANIVFVGDLVDRGPDSRAVIEFLMDAQASGRPWTALYGNHDRLFVRFVQSGTVHDDCIKSGLTWDHERLGGMTTLASYGVDISNPTDIAALHAQAKTLVPTAHIDWLSALPRCFETDTHFFAHAGIRPGIPLPDQTEDDLLWIRKEFHDDPRPHPKMIVHGHTPVDIPTLYSNRLNVDGGAGFGRPIYPVLVSGDQAYMIDGRSKSRLL